ncbi:hypothetical protein K3G39_04385 [Pontibacter sp. HSC-14F20]|uniref:transmembrane 220 family protein n=1 Tax=Pontibacter sp. HSC-14F20 TaxID=2864136 RepID=UPI001C73820B|nr:transmembrane 220 family protein [Pontibacter sp. HSC-14F20]MBX0332469.1 hypothetical protein [Pontibacter sp. HSC-14F20]
MSFKQLTAFLLGLCFVVLAALQYQGPDAAIWIAIFLAAAIFSFTTALERINRVILWMAFVAYAAAAYYFWPGEAALSQGIAIVNGTLRFWALVFASFAMLLLVIISKRSTSLHPPHAPGHVTAKLKKWAN